MEFSIGPLPVAIRTKSSAALTGVAPSNSGKAYVPSFINGVFKYVDPDNYNADEVDEGGLINFRDDHILRIDEIRSFLPSGRTIEALIVDKIQEMTLTVGGGLAAIDLTTLGIEAGDIVTVVSSGPVTDTYTVTRVISATVLEVEGDVVDRNLVANDIFTITNSLGTTERYNHTLVATETLDTEGAPNAVHIINAATAGDSVRIAFSEPPIVLTSQFLKIITNDAGTVDVYVVKASVI